MSINVWQPQGIVVAPLSADTPGQPNVIYESGAKILSPNADGKIFKMLFGSTNGPCYAESADGLTGWTRYASNPVITMSHSAGWTGYPKLFKNGSTYYAYIVNGNFLSMSSWTSPDMVTWTQQVANAVTPTQAWSNSGFFGQLSVAGQDSNGLWWGYYTGYNGTIYQIGRASSTDLLNWTAYAGNPVISSGTPSNICFQQVASRYYGWSQIVQAGIPHFAVNGLPSDISRFYSDSITGPWTGPLTASTIYRTTAAMGIGSNTGQVADPAIIEVNGTTYMYATVTPTGNGAPTNYQIEAYTAPMTIAQLIQTQEGVLNVPFPSNAGLALNLTTLATADFSGANANPIGGSWTTMNAGAGFGASQLVSNTVEPTAINTNCYSYWNGISWANDQWASATLSVATSASVGVALRESTSGAQTAYLFYFAGPAGGLGSTGSFQIGKHVAGTFTSLATFAGTANIGDVITGSAVGTTLSLYQNGNLLISLTDASIASGAAGLVENATVTANAKISAWTGGSVVNAPPYGSGPGTTFVSSPIPVTVTNSSGHSLGLTSPSVSGKMGQSTPVCFTDPSGNEYTTTGSSVGNEIGAPTPVVLCNQQGQPIVPPIVFTSGSATLSISSTLTGKKLGQPTPVMLSSSNGFLYTLTGFTYGTGAQNPTPVALCDTNGNVLTGTIAT